MILSALIAVILAALIFWVAEALGLPRLLSILAAALVLLAILGVYV